MIEDPSNMDLSPNQVNNAISYIPFPKDMVDIADYLVEMAHGRPKYIDGKKDWEVVDNLVKLWMTMRPSEARQFKKELDKFKGSLDDEEFATGDRGEMRVMISIPQYLERLIKAVYPMTQVQDRDFAMEFAKRYKGFQIPDRL